MKQWSVWIILFLLGAAPTLGKADNTPGLAWQLGQCEPGRYTPPQVHTISDEFVDPATGLVEANVPIDWTQRKTYEIPPRLALAGISDTTGAGGLRLNTVLVRGCYELTVACAATGPGLALGVSAAGRDAGVWPLIAPDGEQQIVVTTLRIPFHAQEGVFALDLYPAALGRDATGIILLDCLAVRQLDMSSLAPPDHSAAGFDASVIVAATGDIRPDQMLVSIDADYPLVAQFRAAWQDASDQRGRLFQLPAGFPANPGTACGVLDSLAASLPASMSRTSTTVLILAASESATILRPLADSFRTAARALSLPEGALLENAWWRILLSKDPGTQDAIMLDPSGRRDFETGLALPLVKDCFTNQNGDVFNQQIQVIAAGTHRASIQRELIMKDGSHQTQTWELVQDQPMIRLRFNHMPVDGSTAEVTLMLPDYRIIPGMCTPPLVKLVGGAMQGRLWLRTGGMVKVICASEGGRISFVGNEFDVALCWPTGKAKTPADFESLLQETRLSVPTATTTSMVGSATR